MWSEEGTKTHSPASPPPVRVADPKLPPERRALAWIGKSVLIKGAVISAEDLIIDGRVEGTIALDDHCLTVGVDAVIQADLKACTIIISGAVTGNVTATDRIEILEAGSVDGDITAPRLAVRDGAVLRGRIETAAEAPDQKVNHIPVAV
jgi:cytoskeletal protein CcmA (bactofilin family)